MKSTLTDYFFIFFKPAASLALDWGCDVMTLNVNVEMLIDDIDKPIFFGSVLQYDNGNEISGKWIVQKNEFTKNN